LLGIKTDADQLEITKAYNRKKYEFRGNAQMISKVEAAHSQLMLQAFNARVKVNLPLGAYQMPISSLFIRLPGFYTSPRLQGGKTVPKSIKYADREQLFPWRPKYVPWLGAGQLSYLHQATCCMHRLIQFVTHVTAGAGTLPLRSS
jgi:hypothetical protein